jgi:hypothetical protein
MTLDARGRKTPNFPVDWPNKMSGLVYKARRFVLIPDGVVTFDGIQRPASNKLAQLEAATSVLLPP